MERVAFVLESLNVGFDLIKGFFIAEIYLCNRAMFTPLPWNEFMGICGPQLAWEILRHADEEGDFYIGI